MHAWYATISIIGNEVEEILAQVKIRGRTAAAAIDNFWWICQAVHAIKNYRFAAERVVVRVLDIVLVKQGF